MFNVILTYGTMKIYILTVFNGYVDSTDKKFQCISKKNLQTRFLTRDEVEICELTERISIAI